MASLYVQGEDCLYLNIWKADEASAEKKPVMVFDEFSRDQNEERQVLALLEMGVPEQNIYVDKQSGKDFNRPQYKKMLRRVKPDDLIYIKSIDRLGRNYTEILDQWKVRGQGVDRREHGSYRL